MFASLVALIVTTAAILQPVYTDAVPIASRVGHDAPTGYRPLPTPTPVPTEPAAATGEASGPLTGPLTRAQVEHVLLATGWPASVVPEALIVSFKESSYNASVVNSIGCCYGLFQLHAGTWASYCGITRQQLLEAYANAECAWQVYQYDIGRGYAPWTQWQAKPW